MADMLHAGRFSNRQFELEGDAHDVIMTGEMMK